MNPYVKLLKITGAVCLSCVCLTSKADPKYMTLEEIKKLLETDQKQFETKRSNLLKQMSQLCDKSINICDEIRDKICLLADEVSQASGIRNIEYNTEGEPTLIEFCGFDTLADDLFYIDNVDNDFVEYNEKRLKKWLSNQDNLSSLDKISKELNTEELKERGITNEEIGLFGDAKVHEITFDSILKSGFFSKDDVDKAKSWIYDTVAIKKAIKEYVEKTTVLKRCKVTVSKSDYEWDLSDSSDDNLVCKENYKEYYKDVDHLYYRVTDAKILDRLTELVYRNNFYKGGREMIILLLLLDDMTPQECQLKWYINEDDWSYSDKLNIIHIDMLDFYNNDYNKNGEVSLLHEIGHYLQTCFGLKQTFESYKNPFAEKLLLLQDNPEENEKTISVPRPFPEENEKTISVPRPLYNLFAIFDNEPSKEVESDEDYENKNIQKDFTEKDLFMRWQLVSRWSRGSEISNILGVYFDQNNIYINNFSDICHERFSQYGHNFGRNYKRKKLGDIAFDNPEHSTIFENIVARAKELEPDTESIKLLCMLCKVNRVKYHGVIDTFDETIDRNKVEKPRWYDDIDR